MIRNHAQKFLHGFYTGIYGKSTRQTVVIGTTNAITTHEPDIFGIVKTVTEGRKPYRVLV